MIVKEVLTVVTDGSQNADVQTDKILNGKLLSIIYDKDGGANPYTNGVDFTITEVETGQNLWTEANVNASKQCNPRTALHGVDGVASLYATSGLPVVGGLIGIADSRIRVQLAQGGAVKTGRFTFILEQ